MRLGIEIHERKHIEVAFEGNRSRSSGKLEDALTLLEHGAYDDVEAAASAAALEHDYRARGHMLVKVTWRRERLSDQSDRLVFVIDEGPVLKVRGISFVGNRAIPSDVLADRLRTRVYPFLGVIGLGEGGFASPKQLELDVQSLSEHYAAVGYPETKVRAEIAPRPGQWRPLTGVIDQDEEAIWRKANSLYIRFLIEESPLVWVAGDAVSVRERRRDAAARRRVLHGATCAPRSARPTSPRSSSATRRASRAPSATTATAMPRSRPRPCATVAW